MAGCLAIGKSKYLERANASMKEQKEPVRRKRRRHLEVLSIACSTVGINLVIAYFCGVTNTFGFNSLDVIFKCAFAFQLASVFLGIVAMISSLTGYDCLKIASLSTPNYSALYRLLRAIHSSGNKCIQEPDISCKLESNQSATEEASGGNGSNVPLKFPDDQPRVIHKDCGYFPETSEQDTLRSQRKGISCEAKAHLGVSHITSENCTEVPKSTVTSTTSEPDKNEIAFVSTSVTNCNNQRKQNCYYDSSPSRIVKDHGLSAKTSARSFALLPWKYSKQSDGKALLQLKKRRNTFLFDQSFAKGRLSGFAEASRLVSCDIERNDERTRLTFIAQDSFVAEVGANEEPFQIQVNPRQIFSRRLPRVTDPYDIKNTCFEEGRGHSFHEEVFSLKDTCQRYSKDHVSDVISKLNKMNFLS